MRDLYDPRAYNLGESSVSFITDDERLKWVFDECERLCLENIKDFSDYKVIIEGAKYNGVWLETQPMGGEMYAKRNLAVALNNILIFLRYQRFDGRFPGMIRQGNAWLGLITHYDWMQGSFIPYPALKMYYHIGEDKEYLELLYRALAAFDGYLWKYRDSDGDGCLETWCIWDTGEDNCTKHILNGIKMPDHGAWGKAYPPEDYANMPYESIEYMGYSYALRNTLSKISEILGDGKADFWRREAECVRTKFCEYLWDEDEKIAFDRDRNNEPIRILMASENIKCLWSGIYTQEMADAFIKHHLLNPEEFFTPYPLPSIAVNDPYFHSRKDNSNCAERLYETLGEGGHDIDDNSWSGPCQGLTYQRSIGALLNYGHHAEASVIGERFLELLKKTGRFVQQYDPMTGEYCEKAAQGYGPTMLAALEYVSLTRGVNIEYGEALWSAVAEENFEYEQKLYGKSFKLIHRDGFAEAYIDGELKLSFSRGARILTDLEGNIISVYGADTKSFDCSIKARDESYVIPLCPNGEYGIKAGNAYLKRQVAFDLK